jgi:signal transduction histidine kinase/predicted RNA-binding protein with RPS1 domain
LSAHTGSACQINQVVVAQVEQAFPFGVFVRLPDGTQGYVRRRELTQAGNLDPRQVVSEGQEIKAVVIALAEPGRNLELSVRRAELDPWDTFVQSFEVRDTVTATVKGVSAGGVFVQIIPGVDGFIPLIELAPWPVEQPNELLWVGDQVEAMIIHLDRQAKRVRLSIRQQMEHQATVGKVLAIPGESGVIEEELPDEGESGPVEETGVDPAVARQVGRVLVVDDYEVVREPLVEWLCRLGFAADGAELPDQALTRLRERSYGLALIDLDLSGRDSLGLIQTLEEVAPDTRVAIMSAPDLIAQRSGELAALGVVDIFAKPLNLDEIHEVLIRLGQGETPGPLWLPTPEPGEEEVQSSLRRLAETMRSGLPLAARFEAGLKELVRLARAEEGVVFHLDPSSQQVSIVAQVGELPLNQEAIYALAESPVRDLIRERGEVFETHVSRKAQRRFSKLLTLLPFESCLGVPILAGGEVQYALFLFHREPDAFSLYRLRDAQAMAVLFSVALESQALEQRIRAASPFLLSGHLAAGFGHEVYNKMSGLEIQLHNLRADCERLGQGAECRQPAESFDFVELSRATDRLLDVAMDLKDTVELFRELIRVEQEEEVDVNEVVRRAALLLRPTARQHRVRVEMDLAPDLPPIVGSAVRLQQVFANVMLNAVQQTAQKMERWSDGQGMLQVATAWEPGEERPIRVCFTDNGPGIHRQLWENIFALGFSTRLGGAGLGLFIARSLAESMGGRIMVEQSVIPVGTTFRVELPGA